jgi:flagellar protein FliS
MNPYFEQTILNADPIELVRVMYQRAISLVREARAHLKHESIAKRSAAIARVYAVLAELLAALRPELAPELSRRLQSLYLYMQQRLLDANMQQADRPLEEVLGLLITLEGAWSGVAAEMASNKEMPEATEVPGAADVSRWRQAGQGSAGQQRNAAQGSEGTARHAISA